MTEPDVAIRQGSGKLIIFIEMISLTMVISDDKELLLP